MSGFDRRRVAEVLQEDVLPPGHFQDVVARRDDWVGVFCYDFYGPRWNKFIPVPGKRSDTVPSELLDLAEEIGGDNVSLQGEAGFVDEVVEELGLESVETAFEMTYLVPDDLPAQEDLPDVDYRVTDSEDVREDFLDIFRKAFGEEDEDGNFSVSDEMRLGIRKIISEDKLGVERVSFVGYVDGEAVSTGTLTWRGDDGFLFNVASHPDHRGEGYGAGITVKLYDEAERRGLEQVFIGTQPGSDVENFYRNIGCREVFRMKCVEIDLEELRSLI